MTAPTFALWHGLKAAYVPRPISSDGKWTSKELGRIMNQVPPKKNNGRGWRVRKEVSHQKKHNTARARPHLWPQAEDGTMLPSILNIIFAVGRLLNVSIPTYISRYLFCYPYIVVFRPFHIDLCLPIPTDHSMPLA